MRRALLGAVLLIVASTSVASAQAKEPKKPDQKIEFKDADPVVGEVATGDGHTTWVIRHGKHPVLIRVRQHFTDKVAKSAEDRS